MGSEKGGAYERDVSRKLTIWASGKNMPMWYWRTSGSGSQASRSGDLKSPMAGDIMATVPEGAFFTDIFVVECKNRKNENVLSFIDQEDSDDPYLWWLEAMYESMATKRLPMVVFHKYKSSKEYCIIRRTCYNKLRKHLGKGISHLSSQGEATIVDFDKFLAWAKPWEMASIFIGPKAGKRVRKNYYGG